MASQLSRPLQLDLKFLYPSYFYFLSITPSLHGITSRCRQNQSHRRRVVRQTHGNAAIAVRNTISKSKLNVRCRTAFTERIVAADSSTLSKGVSRERKTVSSLKAMIGASMESRKTLLTTNWHHAEVCCDPQQMMLSQIGIENILRRVQTLVIYTRSLSDSTIQRPLPSHLSYASSFKVDRERSHKQSKGLEFIQLQLMQWPFLYCMI